MRSEEGRQAIYEALCAGVGQRAAEAVMEMLDRIDRIMLAQEGGAAALRGEMAELRGEVAVLASSLHTDMASLRVELKDDIARLERRIDKLAPTIVMAHIGSMIAFASLLFGIARFT